MAKTVSIFFNNVNLQVYSQDEESGRIESVYLDDISTTVAINTPKGPENIHLVPAMVCYADRIYCGQEVFTYKKFNSPATFKYMKQYMGKRQYLPRIIGDQEISTFQAASDLLINIIDRIHELYGKDQVAMIVFVVQPLNFSTFASIIEEFCLRIGLINYKIVDEAVCALLAYDLANQIDQHLVYLLFGYTTIDLYLIKVVESNREPRLQSVVICSMHKNYGGADIDKAIQNYFAETVPLNMKKTREIRGKLNFKPQYQETINGVELRLSRKDLYKMLDQKGYGEELKVLLRDLFDLASGFGVTHENINYVLGSGLSMPTPYYKDILKNFFGPKLLSHKAHEAIPIGALRYLRKGGLQATIKANYAIRSRTAKGDGYRYDIIVPKGTPYPTQHGITSIVANGFFVGQLEVELDIFRMDRPESSSDREIVIDDAGRMQLEENLGDEQQSFINEARPEIIPLDPPALDNEQRLEITFDISLNCDLLITVKDLRRNQTIWKRKKSVRLE
jgi:molecular chaperone DnaK (HSP70)